MGHRVLLSAKHGGGCLGRLSASVEKAALHDERYLRRTLCRTCLRETFVAVYKYHVLLYSSVICSIQVYTSYFESTFVEVWKALQEDMREGFLALATSKRGNAKELSSLIAVPGPYRPLIVRYSDGGSDHPPRHSSTQIHYLRRAFTREAGTCRLRMSWRYSVKYYERQKGVDDRPPLHDSYSIDLGTCPSSFVFHHIIEKLCTTHLQQENGHHGT